MSKEVIATDIDEVLFPFVDEFSIWHNNEYGTSLDRDSFHSYEFSNVLQIDVPESVHRIHSFLSIEHAHLDVSPLEESQESLSKLSEIYNVVAITARHPQFEEPTWKYLTRYFKDSIGDLNLIGHAETMDIVRTKADVCKEVGAVALIDDSFDHVSVCATSGLQGILFGKYTWTTKEELPDEVFHYSNWSGVLGHFGV